MDHSLRKGQHDVTLTPKRNNGELPVPAGLTCRLTGAPRGVRGWFFFRRFLAAVQIRVEGRLVFLRGSQSDLDLTK